MNKKHFVYRHISPSGKVYVGQAVNVQRRWGYKGEQYLHKKKDGTYVQAAFARAILKYGWENFIHEILLEEVSKSEANYAEKYLIKWYKLRNVSYNITDGGEGTCGIHQVLSKERRKVISEFMRTNHPMKGKHHTPEAMAKIIAANRNRTYTKEQKAKMAQRAREARLGIPLSKESREKLSNYRKKHPELWIGGRNKREVHQYDLDGNYVNSYPSAMDAALALGKNINSDISCCVKGKTLSAGGYFWRPYKSEHIDVSNYKILKTPNGARIYDMSLEGRTKRRIGHGKPVNQYSLSGKYLNTYNSATEAGDSIGGYHSGINKCCSKTNPKHKTAGGYLWEYDTGDNRRDKVAI